MTDPLDLDEIRERCERACADRFHICSTYPCGDVLALLARVEQLAGALEDLVAYARSGWTDGTYGYCLCCDSSLTGKGKGQRAATFDEIQHDPECPVPGARTLLGAPREGPA